jgi:hypothetical protein
MEQCPFLLETKTQEFCYDAYTLLSKVLKKFYREGKKVKVVLLKGGNPGVSYTAIFCSILATFL